MMFVGKFSLFVYLSIIFASSRVSLAQVELIGIGRLPANTADRSGSIGILEDGTPANCLSGLSAIDYTGHGNRFVVMSDRGPLDGQTSYGCRLHELDIQLDLETKSLSIDIVRSQFLQTSSGQNYSGSVKLATSKETRIRALDPEGLRILPNGEFLVSDEYGPSLRKFDVKAWDVGNWFVPSWMQLPEGIHPNDSTRGLVANRGFEGLSWHAPSQTIVVATQSSLLQESRSVDNRRLGDYCRLVMYRLESKNPIAQWAYRLEHPANGISEILAIDRNRFLVIERDSAEGVKAQYKRIYSIDCSLATDISEVEQLNDDYRLVCVEKHLLIDLLSPEFQLSEANIQEKLEGICWGPPLADGRLSLYACFDNDFLSSRENLFLAFAVVSPLR